MKSIRKVLFVPVIFFLNVAPGPVYAGEHTWDVWEVFSNADGTIQFIELHESAGGNAENGLGSNTVSCHPSGNTFAIPATGNVVGGTAFKYYLLATAAFAALPGAPVPDRIIPANFIAIATDNQARFNPWDTANWTAGTLPTNGTSSLQRTGVGSALVSGLNSPTNFAGATAAIDASGGGTPTLPGVPDGSAGSTPLLGGRVTADGASISVSWDTGTCTGEGDHQIVYGQRSGFPAIAGGTYTPLGGQCNIGTASPYAWTSSPSASDGSGLIWFLVVAENNSGTEGSWGKYNASSERNGPGTGGSSAVCSITNRDLTNTCGH